jgi:GNAT superfamily N-acetyltransferase
MSSSEDLEIHEVAASDLRPLRVAVLRGGDPHARAVDDRDDEPGALHLAAVIDGRVVGCGSFYEAPAPTGGDLIAYQLRYMATDPAHQGHGVGTQLLRAAETRLASRGAQVLWANARDSAIGFYVATGWSVVEGSGHISEETDLPHTVVRRRLSRDEPVTVALAQPSDAAALAALRREMFLAMRLVDTGGPWVSEAERYFAEGLADGSIVAVIARTDAGVAAGGAAASLRRDPPNLWNPTGRTAYVHSVATAPGFRRRGVSRAIMLALIGELARRDVSRVELHATGEGEALYRELGFTERSGLEMRLDIPHEVREKARDAQ